MQVCANYVRCNFINGYPCVQRFNQLYCVGKGLEYPSGDIEGYIDDNKALMRRMYGNLVKDEPEPEPVSHRTPASTKPLQSRGVRNFAGRFKRDVLEGKNKGDILKSPCIIFTCYINTSAMLRFRNDFSGMQ